MMTVQWWYLIFAILPTLPNLWSIWHIWSHDFNDDMQKKVLWLVLAVFIPVLGGIIYIVAGRQHAGKPVPRARRI